MGVFGRLYKIRAGRVSAGKRLAALLDFRVLASTK